MTRVFFHVQHLLGIGHLRRAAAIAHAIAAAGIEVTIASGGEPLAEVPLPGRVVQLPPAVAADETFSLLLDGEGNPIDDAWRRRRCQVLLQAFDAARADVLLIELFPFGRRAFRFELIPLIEAAAARVPRPAIAVSLRDILVPKNDAARDAETVQLLRRFFDRVLVHGDPRFAPLSLSFAQAEAIADLVHYTGYVVDPAPAGGGQAGVGEVLVSAGGGVVGGPLLRAALTARPLSAAAERPWRLLTGPNLPPGEAAALAAAAPAGVVVERFRPDFRRLVANCHLSISQAGYNTVMDVLAAGARAVLVPFAAAGEVEQTLRARRLAERGLVELVEADALSPKALAAAIDRAAARRPGPSGIDLGGAAGTAAAVARLAVPRGT